MNQGTNASFDKLKPVCDSVTIKPTEENINHLKSLCQELPDNVIQILHEYVMFPLFSNLISTDVRLNHKLQSLIFETLDSILQRVRVEKIKIFTYLYMALMKSVYDENALNYVVNIDEEIKLIMVVCLISLFRCLSMDLRYELYTKENGLQLSQCCLVCTQLAKVEKLRSLRIKAIECIMILMNVHDGADFTDIELRDNVADVTMSFLPGVIKCLTEVAMGDVKQGHQITALAINALKRIIVLHICDKEKTETGKKVFQYPLTHEDQENENYTSKLNFMKNNVERYNKAQRTNKWYKDTENILKQYIQFIIPLQYYDHPKVRLEMIDFCNEILTYCYRNMSHSTGICTDVLIALSEDDYPEVSKKSRNALNFFCNQKNITFNIIEIVEENLYDVLTKLPRIMNEMDLTRKVNALNLLIGYLQLTQPKYLRTILQLSSHLKRLVQTLLHVSQLERSNVFLFEDHAIKDIEDSFESPVTWKQFIYINEKQLFDKFHLLMTLLSESDAFDILVDQLCDVFLTGNENKKESIFLLNELLSVKRNNNQINLVNRVLEMYIDEENWYLPLTIANSDDEDSISLFNVHNNVIQICLLTEGIGIISNSLEEYFKDYLLKSLYIILERAGSPQPLISAAGLLALSNISHSCKYENVTKLIVDNTDYFSFHIIQRIKKLKHNPQVLDVLNVVMNYSNSDVLPCIMDVINRVLLHSNDSFQEQNTTSFLQVFLSFEINLQRWLNIKMKKDKEVKYIKKYLIDYKKVMDDYYTLYKEEEEFIKDFRKNNENLTSEESQINTDGPMEEEYKKVQPPEHIKLTVDLLKRSLNNLPSKDRQQKLLVIDILKYGIQIIRDWEDELLPIVHLIWSPLINRFKEFSDPLIINRSFDLLSTIATTSKDFIRKRTSKNVFPHICSTLLKLSEQSYLKDKGSAYRYTQAYKLQLNVLQSLAELAIDLEMTMDDLDLAMQAALPYLSNKQPIPLQEYAVLFYKNLARYDFDSVWLFLIEIYGSKRQRGKITVLPEDFKNVESVLKIMNLAKW